MRQALSAAPIGDLHSGDYSSQLIAADPAQRILNLASLTSHGNRRGRADILSIIEAGMRAADPYTHTLELLHVEDGTLIVGNPSYLPVDSSETGDSIFDLEKLGRIFVFGAGKGVQRVAKAIEDVLGDHLTGGHVIAKHGDESILSRVGVTHGAHPVPDEGCVLGCERILEQCQDLRANDLVFTIAANGISSLLTLPVRGVSLEDVRRTTYLMQIERGAPTGDLNAIRNHLDVMKGGRISRYLQPATAIHIIADEPHNLRYYMRENVWLHTLPECSTFADAIRNLRKWDAWSEVPESVRKHLLRADPADETVKADEFERMPHRIFAVMPGSQGMLRSAQSEAQRLGYRPYLLGKGIVAEASQLGNVLSAIAISTARDGTPFETPCALISGGESLVTVGKETGIGGRNQEFALSAAPRIAGSGQVVFAAVDSDGTDGPGPQFADSKDVPQLAGGVVDGETAAEAAAAGISLADEIRHHNTTPPLYKLDSGIMATHNISLNDLRVVLVMGRE